jgi:hypothetical protein
MFHKVFEGTPGKFYGFTNFTSNHLTQSYVHIHSNSISRIFITTFL